jgi:hypothetical protein
VLIKNGIIDVLDWDKHLAIFMHDSSGSIQQKEIHFLANFITETITKQKILTPERIPMLLKVLEDLKKSTGTEVKECISNTLESISVNRPNQMHASLKSYFLKWVDLLNIEDQEAQERQVNDYFTQLGKKVSTNEQILFAFCNVMIKTSIELTLYTPKGERRLNNSTLDYRFIDSFIKLVVVLIHSFPNFSK